MIQQNKVSIAYLLYKDSFFIPISPLWFFQSFPHTSSVSPRLLEHNKTEIDDKPH